MKMTRFLALAIVFAVGFATVVGCGERTVPDRGPMAGDRVVAEIIPALPWKAQQFAQFCVRFKIIDSQGAERGYLKEAFVSPESIPGAPGAEITLLHHKGKSSARSVVLTPDC
ncbi:MAG: hypothetical protein FJ271_23770 [Planctomycetes bacterium]|nr:hypothetical protein [Planctomycetota bacterium]